MPDDIPGVSYRTGPKGWMDKRVFVQWLSEPRAVRPDQQRRTRHIFLDNCGGHNYTGESEDMLERKIFALHHLPANATDLCQPADSFVISKIKDSWTEKWNKKKLN